MVTAEDVAKARCMKDALVGVAALAAAAYSSIMTVTETVLQQGSLDQVQ